MKTSEGYELVAFFSKTITAQNNFDSFSEDERIVKHAVSLDVPGYILNPKHPGLPKLARSYYSAPHIDFSYLSSNDKIVSKNENLSKQEQFRKHVLSDISSVHEGLQRGESSEFVETFVENPFDSNEKTVKYSKVKLKDNRSGETVIRSSIVKEIDRQSE